ncbi:MAG: hypothetical protein J3K34DRAFT_13456 [Monoraphidium minutum]|nr:MAG: hypothetical protein J3K34DRAFT_13456 [Monoraphidium minutum]
MTSTQRCAFALAALVALSGLCRGAEARRLLQLESWPAAASFGAPAAAPQEPPAAGDQPPRVVYSLVDQTGAPIAAAAAPGYAPVNVAPRGLSLLDRARVPQPAMGSFGLPPAAVYYSNINPDAYYQAIAAGARR